MQLLSFLHRKTASPESQRSRFQEERASSADSSSGNSSGGDQEPMPMKMKRSASHPPPTKSRRGGAKLHFEEDDCGHIMHSCQLYDPKEEVFVGEEHMEIGHQERARADRRRERKQLHHQRSRSHDVLDYDRQCRDSHGMAKMRSDNQFRPESLSPKHKPLLMRL